MDDVAGTVKELDTNTKLIFGLMAASENGTFYHLCINEKDFILRKLPLRSILSDGKNVKIYRYSFDSITQLANIVRFGDHFTPIGPKIESDVWLEGFEKDNEIFIYEMQKHQILERLSSKFRLRQGERDLISNWRKITKIEDILDKKSDFYINMIQNSHPLTLASLAGITEDECKQLIGKYYEKPDLPEDIKNPEELFGAVKPWLDKCLRSYLPALGELALQRIHDSSNKNAIVEKIIKAYQFKSPIIYYLELGGTDYFDKCAKLLLDKKKSLGAAKGFSDFREFIHCIRHISRDFTFSKEESEKLESLEGCLKDLRRFIRKHPASDTPIEEFFGAFRTLNEKTIYLVSPEEFRYGYGLEKLPEAVREYDIVAKKFGGQLMQMNLVKTKVGNLGERCPSVWANVSESNKEKVNEYSAPVYRFSAELRTQ